MKRQNAEVESLVYAYGAGEPVEGWPHALDEIERCRALWNRLVDIERETERATLAAAGADVPEIAELVAAIDACTERLRAAEESDVRAILAERRAHERALWPLLAAWRKANKDTLVRLEQARREAVKRARQESDAWWCNYNRVLDDYERARRVVRMFGRKLRYAEAAAARGCLTIQIQRTRSGLGAAPEELLDGTFAALQIGRVDPRAHDRATFRGERRRLCRTWCEFRIDREGHMLRLPLAYDRPLPADARVKRAQLVWRRVAGELRFRLALTITRPATVKLPPSDRTTEIVIDWRRNDDGSLTVARAPAGDLVLPAEWMRRMDRVEHLHAVLARWEKRKDLEPPEHWRRLYNAWRNEMEHLRAKLLGERRERYRLYARSIATTHGAVRLVTPILAAVAQLERGTESNSLRHRACAHALIAELEHQGRKHGCAVEVASAPMALPADARPIRHLSPAKRALLASARELPQSEARAQ